MINKFTISNLKNSLFLLKTSVKSTLGPTGKTALLDNSKELKLVDDGITILKELQFQEKTKNSLLELIRQASLRTNQIVGDGTTTTTLITCVLLEEGLRLILSGCKNIYIIIGMKKILYFLVQKIKQFSTPLTNSDQIIKVLRTSIGNVSENILLQMKNAFIKKGKDGILLIEEKQNNIFDSKIEISEGIQLEQGYISSYFLKNSSKSEINLNNPYVLITDKTIEKIEQIREILQYVKSNKLNLILIAGGFEKSVLSTLIINNLNDNLNVIAIKAPYFSIKRKMILNDISFITSTNFIDEKIYSSNYIFQISDLGKIKKVSINKNYTNITLMNSSKLSLSKRINELQRELKTNDSMYEKDIINYRISLLSGGIAKIYISAPTNSELCKLKYKVEDGVNALKSSFQEGITISSNSFYIHLSEASLNWSTLNLTHDELYAYTIFQKALQIPFCQICENVNLKYPILLDHIKEKGYPFGYDFQKKIFCNLNKEGILDSAKMIRVVLQNSISASTSLLSTF